MENNTSSSTSIELKGLERLFRFVPFRIAHIFEVSSSTSSQDVIDRAPKAWRWVMARHPRMRASLDPNDKENFVATIRPELSESALKESLHIMDEVETKSYSGGWEKYISEECNGNSQWRNRSTLFAMTIMIPSPTKAVLILFSDHCFSDGFSGLVIMRDFLHVLMDTAPSKDPYADYTHYTQDPPTSLPLQAPMSDRISPPTYWRSFVGKCFSGLMTLLVPLGLKYLKTMLRLEHLLPNEPNGKCTANFASGERRNLSDALQKCRAEQTTLMGPICIAIALAMAEATTDGEVLVAPTSDTATDATRTHLQLNMTIDFNLRHRMGMGREHVGTNIYASDPLASWNFGPKGGVPLDAPFWETARDCKKEITEAGAKPTFWFPQYIAPESVAQWAKDAPNGIASDVNVSNLGQWPFDKQIGPLTLEKMYLYNSMSTQQMLPGIVFFVTSVESLQYSMVSLMKDQMADRVLETAVKIVESVGGIGPTTTLREVLRDALKRNDETN